MGLIFRLGDDHDGEPAGGPGLVALVAGIVLNEPWPELFPFFLRRYSCCACPAKAADLDPDFGVVPDIQQPVRRRVAPTAGGDDAGVSAMDEIQQRHRLNSVGPASSGRKKQEVSAAPVGHEPPLEQDVEILVDSAEHGAHPKAGLFYLRHSGAPMLLFLAAIFEQVNRGAQGFWHQYAAQTGPSPAMPEVYHGSQTINGNRLTSNISVSTLFICL